MTDQAPRASGQCHCGEIRYSMSTAVQHHALCHCSDCRRHSGAPLVGWALVGNDEIEISGTGSGKETKAIDTDSKAASA